MAASRRDTTRRRRASNDNNTLRDSAQLGLDACLAGPRTNGTADHANSTALTSPTELPTERHDNLTCTFKGQGLRTWSLSKQTSVAAHVTLRPTLIVASATSPSTGDDIDVRLATAPSQGCNFAHVTTTLNIKVATMLNRILYSLLDLLGHSPTISRPGFTTIAMRTHTYRSNFVSDCADHHTSLFDDGWFDGLRCDKVIPYFGPEIARFTGGAVVWFHNLAVSSEVDPQDIASLCPT